jgi:pimeloyl-ACP methyl ester carboxylesterase
MSDDAPLCRFLRTKLPNIREVERFNWSGRNRYIDRRGAGELLSVELAKQRTRFPKAQQVVIGHSHGGNVAGYALEHLPTTENVKAICLATPFLAASRDSSGGWIGVAGLLAATITGVMAINPDSSWLFYLAVFITVAISISVWGGLDARARSYEKGLMPKFADSCDVLVIRSRMDQAKMALQIMEWSRSKISLFWTKAWKIINSSDDFLFPMVITGVIMGIVVGVITDTYFHAFFDQHRDLWMVVMAINPLTLFILTGFLVPISLLLAIPLLLAVTIIMLTFGTDLYWLPLFCEVSVSTVPYGERGASYPKACGWGHSSVHDNSDAFSEIYTWLSQEASAKTKSASAS